MLENLAEVLDTTAQAFLEEQQGMGACWLDRFLIGLSIVVFAKTLASNCKLANQGHVPGQRQVIGGTNQLFSPKNERSKDLSRLATTLTLEHQCLQTGTSYDPFYNTSTRFVQSKCDKYGMGTSQAASRNEHTGVSLYEAKA